MPFGFKPYRTFGATDNNGGLTALPVANAYATALFKGDPVALSAGFVVRAANGDKILGIFQGAKYIDPTTKQYTVTQYLPASTSSAGLVDGYNSPLALIKGQADDTFLIQARASLAISASDIGKTFTVSIGAGNPNTGISGVVLDALNASVDASMCRIVGFPADVNNVYGVSGNYAEVKIVNFIGNA